MEIPIPTIHLFPILDQNLIELLESLSSEEWHKPTRAKLWTVKDIATHLLDGNMRTLSMSRDHYFGEKPENINSYKDLVAYLNMLNADWVRATKRLSPPLLIELLKSSGRDYFNHLKTWKPFEPAIFPVSWAGEETSKNWFHIAREYTEKWHHQQQIREAVQKPGIVTAELYAPVLKTFMQALPYHYQSVRSNSPATIKVTINGTAGGHWYLTSHNGAWKFTSPDESYATEILLDQETAWKLFTKGLTQNEATELVTIKGDSILGTPILSMLSVMA
jgi:uncharacterized protein (TIGR03083 family)